MDIKLELVKEQILWVDKWTSNLVSNIDKQSYDLVDELGTSIHWQLGHIVSSKYFHAIQSILDPDDEIIGKLKTQIPVGRLFKYYFAGSNPLELAKSEIDVPQILIYLEETDKAVLDILDRLDDSGLAEETSIKNPVAKNKYAALTFTYKHQMWHNGQIAMIKRIIKNKAVKHGV